MNPIELDTSLLSLLPPWYREVLDYQQICLTEQQQFEALAEEIVGVADNFFFQTMDERAVGMWEQVFRIVPNPQVESLAFRRTRVLNRISTRPPYTLGFLYQKLDELIGPGEWKVTVDYPNYTLYIESAAQNQNYATELAFTINRIKPAHIMWVNAPFVRTGLLLSETISSTQRIYSYKLGAWELGRLPFATDGPEGVIKMPETPSIQQDLLAGVANFVSGDVASARVNRTVAITRLTKTVEGSELTVTYTVLPSQATEITALELLDAEGNILTSSTVYIPVTTNVVLKHIIPVAEGVVSNPIKTPLPADLPEDWTGGQTVAPTGAEVGLSEQHGYNYLMEQVNAAQTAAKEIGEVFSGLATLGPDGKVPGEQLPDIGGFYEVEEAVPPASRKANTLYGLILADYTGTGGEG